MSDKLNQVKKLRLELQVLQEQHKEVEFKIKLIIQMIRELRNKK